MTPDQRRRFDHTLSAIRDAERGPTAEALAAAPTLDLWRPMVNQRGMPVLWGEVSGHPKLGADLITTSRLLALDRERGWARSANRWYGLGRPFSDFETDLARSLGHDDAKAGFFGFELAGFTPIDDPASLDEILAAYLMLMRRFEADFGHNQTRDRP